jgi:hypothetical protein
VRHATLEALLMGFALVVFWWMGYRFGYRRGVLAAAAAMNHDNELFEKES